MCTQRVKGRTRLGGLEPEESMKRFVRFFAVAATALTGLWATTLVGCKMSETGPSLDLAGVGTGPTVASSRSGDEQRRLQPRPESYVAAAPTRPAEERFPPVVTTGTQPSP